MGSLSDYLELELLDHVLKVGAFVQPTNIYIALSTADPLDDGSGLAEPSGGSYARVVCNVWDTAASRLIRNTNQVNFAVPTGSWGNITHIAIMDAISGGNMLAHGALTVPKTVSTGDTLYFVAQSIAVSVNTGGVSNYLANKLLDHVFKNSAYTVPTNIYVALVTAAIGDADTGSTITEPVGGSYARKLHNSWNAAAAGASSNNGIITFVTATGAWGTITGFALVDALTVGNVLFYGVLDETKVIGNGDTAKFGDQDLDVTLD